MLMEKEAENLIKNLKFPWKEVLNNLLQRKISIYYPALLLLL